MCPDLDKLKYLQNLEERLRRPVRTLVVEDNNLDFEQFNEVLGRLKGFSVRRAATGTEAIAALENGKWDVIFLDLRLPCMRGLQVLQHAPEPGRVVIVTGLELDDREVVEALKNGAVMFVPKPVTTEKLKPIFTTP